LGKGIIIDFLQEYVESVKSHLKAKWDWVHVVDGMEGSGKSTFGLLIKAIYEGEWNLDRIIYDARELVENMEKLPRKSCIMMDEIILTSYKRDASTAINKVLNKAFSIVRDRNLFFILILPSYFDLDKDLRKRARYRTYCYGKGTQRGWVIFYQIVRTQWTKKDPFQNEIGEYIFPNIPKKIYDDYSQVKRKMLKDKLQEFQDELDTNTIFQKKETKGSKIRQAIKDYPALSNVEIAEIVECTPGYVRDHRIKK